MVLMYRIFTHHEGVWVFDCPEWFGEGEKRKMGKERAVVRE